MSGGLWGGENQKEEKRPLRLSHPKALSLGEPQCLPLQISRLAHVSAQVGRPEGFDQDNSPPTPHQSPPPLPYSLPESPLQLGNFHHIGQRCS